MSETRALDEIFSDICSMEGPLRERLGALTKALETLGTPFAGAYDNLVSRLESGSAGAEAPAIGSRLEPFVLPDPDGVLVSLEGLLANGPVVVSFNRGHWCEFCELELRSFLASHAELAARGATVVSIMPERSAYLRRVREKTSNAITVLSDIDNGYALSLGLVIWLGESVHALYDKFGLDIERYQGNNMWFVPIPATFVVGRDGRIVARHVDPDFRRRMETEEILAALETAE